MVSWSNRHRWGNTTTIARFCPIKRHVYWSKSQYPSFVEPQPMNWLGHNGCYWNGLMTPPGWPFFADDKLPGVDHTKMNLNTGFFFNSIFRLNLQTHTQNKRKWSKKKLAWEGIKKALPWLELYVTDKRDLRIIWTRRYSIGISVYYMVLKFTDQSHWEKITFTHKL